MPSKRRDSKGRVLRNGESQRADGKYMFRYTDCTGKRRTIYSWKLVSTDRLKEGQRDSQALRDKEKKILKDIDDHIKTNDAEHLSVDDLFRQFMDIRQDLRTGTRCNYNNIYNKHIKPAIGNTTIGKIKSTTIQKLYHTMSTDKGLCPSTIRTAHTIIYQIFDNAVRDDILRSNPAANAFSAFRKTTELSSKVKEPLSAAEQEAFIEYVYRNRTYKRYANFFTVLLGTGMRISEALGLRWCDCDFENGLISVTHTLLYKSGEDGRYYYRIETTKTTAGQREIPMFDDVKEALLREQQKKRSNKSSFTVDGYTDFIFLNQCGKVYTQAFIYDTIQNIVTSYNRDEFAKAQEENREPLYIPKISAHIFRHTFCTRMCESNVNIKVLQDIMGHRNIRTTMETYAKATREKKAEAIQALNGAFKLS